jgi:acid phosphatase
MKLAVAALGAVLVVALMSSSAGAARGNDQLQKINHIVVIYEENHSFDNLYGSWEGVNGLENADAAHTTQVDQSGTPYSCLFQLDVNLTSPPLSTVCSSTTPRGVAFNSHFLNTWFTIDDYIPPDATTCPKPKDSFAFPNGILNGSRDASGNLIGIPGGCTRDLVHKFYQEQYQLNGGAQNRYATGSDSAGTVMGRYGTKALPIYRYLHEANHSHYAIADNFFQAAFGGSFLNHQWLIAARTPSDPNAPASQHSLIDSAGFPRSNYPLYNPMAGVTYRDGDFTVPCPSPKAGLACGNWAVNTMQPTNEPFGTFGDKLVVQSSTTIGDELSAAGVSWGWYAGGWDNAAGNTTGPGWTNGPGPTCSDPNHDTNAAYHYPKCPDFAFQFHHQPFSYYANYAPGMPGRSHLRDEVAFENAARSSTTDCNLDSVSFVKPIGEENEHPGYASESNGSTHLIELLQLIRDSACAKDTMVVVTYDEFGGQWDHVSPPGQGNDNGPHDLWGPGTRIPALVVSPFLRGNFAVDHTQYDTTSILAMLEERYGLAPLNTRDAAVNSLSDVFAAKQYEADGG